MEMKQYLLDTFEFNDHANRQVLDKIKELPDQSHCINFFSHLINSQNKWMARMIQNPQAPQMNWWEPVYALEKLEQEWSNSLQSWMKFLESKKEVELFEEVEYIGYDGGRWAAKLKDITLQLNYHSIHHRAQIQTLIRAQGLQPNFIDYIGTTYRKLS